MKKLISTQKSPISGVAPSALLSILGDSGTLPGQRTFLFGQPVVHEMPSIRPKGSSALFGDSADDSDGEEGAAEVPAPQSERPTCAQADDGPSEEDDLDDTVPEDTDFTDLFAWGDDVDDDEEDASSTRTPLPSTAEKVRQARTEHPPHYHRSPHSYPGSDPSQSTSSGQQSSLHQLSPNTLQYGAATVRPGGVIGSGAEGEVSSAVMETPGGTHHHMALKRGPDVVHELRVSRAINAESPHLVTAINASDTGNLVLTRLGHGTLFSYGPHIRDFLKTTEDIPLKRLMVLDIVENLLFGISELVIKNFKHLDINPNNIVVFGTHTLGLIDLGLAKEEGCTHNGTPAFQSPETMEQMTALRDFMNEINNRTDLFSFGATLINLLFAVNYFNLNRASDQQISAQNIVDIQAHVKACHVAQTPCCPLATALPQTDILRGIEDIYMDIIRPCMWASPIRRASLDALIQDVNTKLKGVLNPEEKDVLVGSLKTQWRHWTTLVKASST